MEEAIVLYPSPPIGHLISMVELGKLLLTHLPSLSIHILISSPPYNAGDTAPYVNHVSAAFPSITFHHLPTTTLPPSVTAASSNHETLNFELLRSNNPNVHQVLVSVSKNYTILALIADFFCFSVLSVTSKLDVPAYFFSTSGAGCLSLFLYFPTLHENTTKSFKDIKTLFDVPGTPSILSTDMPKPILERDDKAYHFFLDGSKNMLKSAGIIVNTFVSLEPRSIKAITDGLCVPTGTISPIYCVGPLVTANNSRSGSGMPECLSWLDSKPSGSVVFLCFGSLGLFSADQLKEIAFGLERSGQRFLWVVRNPPSENQSVAISARPDPDLEMLLPKGFLDRTRGRGLVVKTWAPQAAVLNHDSVGGFVTHCGWNSVLEAVCAGVPMVAWPLYAEQRFNKVMLVEEIKIALPMDESEENGLVSSAEVEKRVRELMDSEEGDSIRKRTIEMKNEAEAALSDGGSSRVALTELFKSWKRD